MVSGHLVLLILQTGVPTHTQSKRCPLLVFRLIHCEFNFTDLYDAWINERINHELFVETWQNGRGSLESNCTEHYKVPFFYSAKQQRYSVKPSKANTSGEFVLLKNKQLWYRLYQFKYFALF